MVAFAYDCLCHPVQTIKNYHYRLRFSYVISLFVLLALTYCVTRPFSHIYGLGMRVVWHTVVLFVVMGVMSMMLDFLAQLSGYRPAAKMCFYALSLMLWPLLLYLPIYLIRPSLLFIAMPLIYILISHWQYQCVRYIYRLTVWQAIVLISLPFVISTVCIVAMIGLVIATFVL